MISERDELFRQTIDVDAGLDRRHHYAYSMLGMAASLGSLQDYPAFQDELRKKAHADATTIELDWVGRLAARERL